MAKWKTHKVERIVARARRMGRVKDNLVLCDVCDTPASKRYSMVIGWTGCGACATGEAAEVNPDDFIEADKC